VVRGRSDTDELSLPAWRTPVTPTQERQHLISSCLRCF